MRKNIILICKLFYLWLNAIRGKVQAKKKILVNKNKFGLERVKFNALK